jgi:repressor LexA
MTPKQKKVLDFIMGYTDRHGFAPSQVEIAKGCEVRSLGTIQHHLKHLQREGLLSRRWNGRRAIEVNCPIEATRPGSEIPYVGIVAGGKPIEALQQNEVIEVPSSLAGPGNVVYEVRGDSMVDQGIMDGDYVIVHSQPVAENGQTVIAELNGEITIKRLVRKGGKIELHPANPMLSPMPVSETDVFWIRGILVGSLRIYNKWKVSSVFGQVR